MPTPIRTLGCVPKDSSAATNLQLTTITAEEEEIIETNLFKDEDNKLFLATGYRYTFAHQRGFPYPWCAKKHGRKGWIVRDCPPPTFSCATNYVGATGSRPLLSSQHRHSTTKGGVEFEGWKQAKKVLNSRQMLLQRFGLQGKSLAEHQLGGAVAVSGASTENNENAAQRAIDNWFHQTPAVMKQKRKVHQETMQSIAEKKREREEVDLRRKQREESREMKGNEKMRKRHKILEKQRPQCQEVVIEKNAANEESEGAAYLGSGTPESPHRHNSSEQPTLSSPSRTKRKGTHPKRDNKYRHIERSFIENQSLLLSPVQQTHDSHSLLLPPSTTPTRMTTTHDTTNNPLPISPTRMKYKRTQPRKNQQYNSQCNSIILGEDPVMDQMIEDIVKEFTTEARPNLFDGGAVSALREAAMDMVVHSREEKDRLTSAGSSSAANSSSPHLDHDEKRMEFMIEQLIGEVAHDSGCKFEGDALEALKMAAREIVTNDNDSTPVTGQSDQPSTEAVAANIGEGKKEEPSPTNALFHDIQPLQLENEDSNMSEIGGMIAQLVDDLGKESDIQFDSSAVEALKKASRLV